MGFIADLEGTAIAYTAEADRLVVDGRFQLDLSLADLAERLGISAESIADPRSRGKVDPDAVLFTAQAGKLADETKTLLREIRKREALAGKPPSPVIGEWVVTKFAFTLNHLKHPSDDEKRILAAISRSAAEIMPQPGDGIRAVPVTGRDLDRGGVSVSAGMLPIEPLQAGPACADEEPCSDTRCLHSRQRSRADLLSASRSSESATSRGETSGSPPAPAR
jgi:hypothetical protein